MKKIILLPVAYGVCGIKNGKKVTALISKGGRTQIFQKKCSKINNKLDIFLVRGFIYLIYGFYYTFMGLFEFNELYNKSASSAINKTKNSLNISVKSIIIFIILICGLILSYFLLGFLPIKLSFYLSPKNYDLFLKRLIIAVLKCLIIYLAFLALKLSSVFTEYYKFNSAIQKEQEKNGDINFLAYFVCSILFVSFVLSFIGVPASFWYSIIVNPIISVLCFAINFELFGEIQRLRGLKWVIAPFNFLINEKPSQKEIKCVNIVLKEFEQAGSQKDFMEEKNADNQIAFSESYVLAKEKLEKANKFEKSDLDFIYCEILNKNRAEIKLTRYISKDAHKRVLKAVERRAGGEPITKIFNHANFYGLDFKVTKDVLSPRMDTEILVEEVLKDCTPKTKVLDIGTGSGAIAITVAKLANCKVTAVDISDDALLVAKENAKLSNACVVFKKSNLFGGLSRGAKFNIIVSNPPYIPSKDIESLDDEVKKFDPLLALDGGETGLDFYERIIEEAPKKLEKNGKVFFEVGVGQAKDVKKLLQKNFKDIRIVKDLNKIERVVVATLQ